MLFLGKNEKGMLNCLLTEQNGSLSLHHQILLIMTTNSKEWIQYMMATLMVVSGILLSIISFFTHGDVTEGVLWYMAQGLTFAGAIFGVSVYFKTKLGESEYRIKEFINKQIKTEANEKSQ